VTLVPTTLGSLLLPGWTGPATLVRTFVSLVAGLGRTGSRHLVDRTPRSTRSREQMPRTRG
jgi:hypothetical protein